MQVDHGGLELGVAQVLLDHPQVDSRLEQMGGIGVPKGMDRDAAFLDASFPLGLSEGFLHAALRHGSIGRSSPIAASAQSGEDQARVAVPRPVPAQSPQGGLGQGHEAVLGPFAAVDMDHHAPAVDIGDLQALGLLQAQSAGIDGREEGPVVGGAHTAEHRAHLLHREYRRQAALALGAHQLQGMPVAPQGVDKKMADTAIADAHRARRPAVAVLAVQEVLLKLGLRDLVRGLAVELTEHAQGAHVGFLGALAQAIELQSVDRFLVPVGHHHGSPVRDGTKPRDAAREGDQKTTDRWVRQASCGEIGRKPGELRSAHPCRAAAYLNRVAGGFSPPAPTAPRMRVRTGRFLRM
jgi:hypothetical protein